MKLFRAKPTRQARRREARAAKQPRTIRPPHPPRPPRRGHRLLRPVPLTILAIALIAATAVFILRREALPKPVAEMTAADLARLSDRQLARLDPLVMNLVVARGIPALSNLDISHYAKTVDDWAASIDAANKAAEPSSKNDPTYRVSREFWLAGGMAVMLAGPGFGVSYTRDPLDLERPEQQFIHGIIDDKFGTCATMPVLYMAIGHRLGWPIKAVVSRDHMWARWDDGVAPEKGGKRFNLEATNASSRGGEGSFASLTDEQYAAWLGTPRHVIESGSDMTSLTPRQTLGVFLQARAGYWWARRQRGDRERMEADIALAARCFPENVDIQECFGALVEQERIRQKRVLGEVERDHRHELWMDLHGHRRPKSRPKWPVIDVDRINRENFERLKPRFPVHDPANSVHDAMAPAWPGSDPMNPLHPPK